MLSRAKPALDPNVQVNVEVTVENKNQEPKLDAFISRRDYVGAITLLEFYKASGKNSKEVMLWLGYSQVHLGEYHKALETYQEMAKEKDYDITINLFLGICYFFLGMYKEADDAAQRLIKLILGARLVNCKIDFFFTFHTNSMMKNDLWDIIKSKLFVY